MIWKYVSKSYKILTFFEPEIHTLETNFMKTFSGCVITFMQ